MISVNNRDSCKCERTKKMQLNEISKQHKFLQKYSSMITVLIYPFKSGDLFATEKPQVHH